MPPPRLIRSPPVPAALTRWLCLGVVIPRIVHVARPEENEGHHEQHEYAGRGTVAQYVSHGGTVASLGRCHKGQMCNLRLHGAWLGLSIGDPCMG